MRIILAEDDVLFREGLCALLPQFGHEVLEAVSDRPSLECSIERWMNSDGKVDLVITDVRMPPTHTDDGLAAALKIRASYSELPILVLSQFIGDAYAIRLLTDSEQVEQGGTGYLLKDRIGRIDEFLRSAQVVADGGVVIDPKVVRAMLKEQRASELTALTSRERDVIELLASGRTNEQIASELFVTPTAVVKHIGNIFTKLGLQPADGNRRVLAVLRYLEGNQDRNSAEVL
ncbi:response regulator transcription factor [Leucobacter viscericola]|uniref:Response regulator transcription factor n=1 Tax=Leucobacter viscericola TaxID=2714935 RepID=A0A6G7XJZ1_9MICO|nr:response regulator transcription factor [Leucobacter viscericola]QIK64806.1 response regulator transcription factor [Leucobacter viscericola]